MYSSDYIYSRPSYTNKFHTTASLKTKCFNEICMLARLSGDKMSEDFNIAL